MKTQTHESLDSAMLGIFKEILSNGETVSPRGLETSEIENFTFELLDPRRRLLSLPLRKWSLPLAIGEFCWHMRASTDVEQIAHYAPSWRAFEVDGHVRGSCYGNRIFSGTPDRPSQWDNVIKLLRIDPSSRRAVLLFFDATLAGDPGSPDVPCAISMQFVVRHRKLNATVMMRSNDCYLGLPYDVFFFTMLQELAAKQLGYELGSYIHTATSLHLYEKHKQRVRDAISAKGPHFRMPAMEGLEDIPSFLKAEQHIREGTTKEANIRPLHGYWESLLRILSLKREGAAFVSPPKSWEIYPSQVRSSLAAFA